MNKSLIMLTLATLLMFAVSATAQTDAVVAQEECTPKPFIIPLPYKKGSAVAEEVLEGTTFTNKDAVNLPGTMVNNGAVTFDPGTFDQNVPEGYHNGSGAVKGDPNLLPGNIKNGATIFGVTGTSIEPSGTATPAQVLAEQTFSNASGPATGTMPDSTGSITPTATPKTIPQGYHDGTGSVDGDENLLSGNIKNGTTIFGVAGTVIQSSGTATAGQVLNGQTFSNASGPATGTMPTQTLSETTTAVSAGYYLATDLATVDPDLLAQNICAGVTLFGVNGTQTCSTPQSVTTVTTATGRVWMDRNLGASQVATSSRDAAAYGDLYQWGRLTDGHEKRTSGTTPTLAISDVPGHGLFITPSGGTYDWSSSSNTSRWQGVNGINNPCPSGFRLPTVAEFQTEVDTWATRDAEGAFGSNLKLTRSGSRMYSGGIDPGGNTGYYATADNSGSGYSSLRIEDEMFDLFFLIPGVSIPFGLNYASATSVRCIQDNL